MCVCNVHLRVFLSHRTLVPVQYPPHVVALGCLYTAALLSSAEPPHSLEPSDIASSQRIFNMLNKKGDWEEKLMSQVGDLEGIFRFRLH